jgi:heterodisulfide reductase subunit A-like polyferredoxin
MAVAKARRLRPIEHKMFSINQRALVIGGGLAGMASALSIARQGFDVYLVEREAELGGNLRHIHVGLTPQDGPQRLLRRMVAAVMAEPHIQVYTSARLVELGGYTGQYRSALRLADGSRLELEHGALVVATGGKGITPSGYMYGEHHHVLTQSELEAFLSVSRTAKEAGIDRPTRPLPMSPDATFVMIQCVGSRDEEHPYCSRVCCTQALKNALALKRELPEARVIVLYRDLRSYGFREILYRQARQAGVIFLEYSEDQKPQVSSPEDSHLEVLVKIQPEGETVKLRADWVILSTGIEPEPENAELARLLKVPLNETGFFLEAHVKLRPVDFAAEGIFLAGLAHSPRTIEETIAQAQAASVRAVALLSRPQLEATPIVASVNPKLCAACGLCVQVCPYGARILEPGMDHAEVIEVLCQGCGACVVACPNKASQQKGFEFDQIFSMLDVASL